MKAFPDSSTSRTRSANSDSPAENTCAFSRHIPTWSARRSAMMSVIDAFPDARNQPPHGRVASTPPGS